MQAAGQSLVNEDFQSYATPVPEPLTMLGAGTAVGFGAFFKRKLNQKSKQDGDKA